MDIYIVIRDCNYDGSQILGAFRKEEKAKNFRLKYLVENKKFLFLDDEVFVEKVELK